MVFNLLQLMKNLVFDTFTFRLFSTNFKFQVNSLFLTSSGDSVTIAAFRNSQGQPLLKSRENASRAIKIHKNLKENSGEQQYLLKTHCCIHNQPVSLLLTLSYLALTSVMIKSGTSITLIAHHIIFLGMRWNAFLRSIVDILVFILEMLIIYLLFHSHAIVPSLMMAFFKRVIASLLVSCDAFTISLIVSGEQGALPFFILFNRATVSSFAINGAGPRTVSTGGRLSSGQVNSAFRRFP